MKTEELNDYIFSYLVMKAAHAIKNMRIDALEASGKITNQEALNIRSPTRDDLKEALKVLQHNRKAVLDTLLALESAPADSSESPQGTV